MNQWQREADFARNADFDCFLLAGRYTLLEQEPIHEYLPLCLEKNISVFLGGVFNTGIHRCGCGDCAGDCGLHHPRQSCGKGNAPPDETGGAVGRSSFHLNPMTLSDEECKIVQERIGTLLA